jgi:hypothetical protein
MKQKVKYYKIALEAFKQDINVVETLMKNGANKSISIELAYELQAGDYTRNFNELNLRRNKEIHTVINKYVNLPGIESVGVFGIGEAKNLIGFNGKINNLFGVELSFSRLRFAYDNLIKLPSINSFQLIKGDASENIFRNDSFDISITLHSIEPNGNEQGAIILKNVINSSAKYVLIFEPDFSTAHDEMKKRMLKYDYVRNLSNQIDEIDSINLIDKYVMNIQESNDNLTTCWVIEKKQKKNTKNKKMICPFSKGDLIDYPDIMYSPDAGLAYAKINDFIFLNKGDAIFIGKKD